MQYDNRHISRPLVRTRPSTRVPSPCIYTQNHQWKRIVESFVVSLASLSILLSTRYQPRCSTPERFRDRKEQEQKKRTTSSGQTPRHTVDGRRWTTGDSSAQQGEPEHGVPRRGSPELAMPAAHRLTPPRLPGVVVLLAARLVFTTSAPLPRRCYLRPHRPLRSPRRRASRRNTHS